MPNLLGVKSLCACFIILLLGGCAITTTRQCSIGVSFLGPFPVPTASCDLIFEPDDEEDD